MASPTKRKKLSPPIHLEFKDLTVKTSEGKYILQNITGEVKPGEILAIMGPSGELLNQKDHGAIIIP